MHIRDQRVKIHNRTYFCLPISIIKENSFSGTLLTLRYQNVVTRQRLTLCVASIWVVSLVIVYVVAKVTHFHHEYEHHIYLCTVDFKTVRDSQNALIITFVAGLLPISGIFASGNISIYRISKHHHQRCQQHVDQRNTKSVTLNGNSATINIKGLMTILLSTIIRVVCWFPIFALGIINWSSGAHVHRSIRYTAQLFIYCNSFSSWLIYTTTHVTYREAQNNLFRRIKRQISRMKSPLGNVSPLSNTTVEVFEL